MDSRSTDKTDDPAVAETPEDVAVLYSWANLHGAKYRDFSASRREYRAQLRHRAAEQVREQALLAQAEAEAAATAAESAARHATQAARTHQAEDADSAMRRALHEAEDAARTAAAERVEAARRAEAAAIAEAAARREEREIAEAHASAQRQAARYADSEMRRKAAAGGTQAASKLPGKTADPYTVYSTPQAPAHSQPSLQPATGPSTQPISSRRPQGYHPDDASGVRQIYRGPDLDAAHAEYTSTSSLRHSNPAERRAVSPSAEFQGLPPIVEPPVSVPRPSSHFNESQASFMDQRRTDPQPHAVLSSQGEPVSAATTATGGQWPPSAADRLQPVDPTLDVSREGDSNLLAARPPAPRQTMSSRITPSPAVPRPVSPFSQALVPSDSTRGRRAQDDFDYQQSQGFPETPRRSSPDAPPEPAAFSSLRSPYPVDPAGPAWLYAPPAPQVQPKPIAQPPVGQSSVADTLQHSRERVAARWFALKGVFEQPGQDQPEVAPVRQKETRTPVLAVFS
ncbi:MAG: hypothetical protein ACRD3K_12165, partial [Edaphobacter sp.]